MASEHKPDLHLEIAHVLFMDIVGYSKLLINEERDTPTTQSNRPTRRISAKRKRSAN